MKAEALRTGEFGTLNRERTNMCMERDRLLALGSLITLLLYRVLIVLMDDVNAELSVLLC